MEKTTLKMLADYFNEGTGKVPLRDFAKELKALSDTDRSELATGVSELTGDTLKR